MTPNPHDIQHLRERLKALGYLDAPVDRYVLGSASTRAGALRFALSAGLRVGLIAGLLLGLSAALALAIRAPGFIATRRDAIVIAAALSVLFTVITAVAVAATVMIASWFARRSSSLSAARARGVAAAAGIIAALGFAAYLTLWWNAAQDLFTGLTFAWNVVALALAAVVALLLAHAVSVVILAALARRDDASEIRAGGLLSSRAFLAAFGVLLFAGSATILGFSPGRSRGFPPSQISVQPTGYTLRVIAIDGVDLAVVERLRAAGALPALSRVLAGARLPLQRTGSAQPDPARDWTTIATGRPAEVHGITALEARRAVGIEGRLPAGHTGLTQSFLTVADLLRLTTPSVLTRDERRVPTFWEVASAGGLRTAVVNWWATWPAPAGDDLVITDRAVLRLDTGGALDAEIAPPAVYDAMLPRWAGMRQRAAERASAVFADIANPELKKIITRSAELDMLVETLGHVSIDPRPFDLRVVYLPGLDIAQFSLLQASAGDSVSAVGERVAAIERYYRFLDELIASLIAPSPRHIDAVLLWPGRASAREGAMFLAGAPIQDGARPGARCENCYEAGATATLLYLLGLPMAHELRMNPAMDVVTAGFIERHPLRFVPNYEAAVRRPSARTGQPLDAEALERLRSLGYIR